MKKLNLVFLLSVVVLAGCSTKEVPVEDKPVAMANPASVYCNDHGGKLEIVTDASGGQVGMCHLSEGSTCEERAYMRGECVEKNTNTANQDDQPVACTMDYNPVCAKVNIQCITTPCEPIEQTFGNRCSMNANKLAEFLYEGECK